MKFLREYIPEIIAATISLVAGLLILLIRGTSQPEGYIVLALGAQITVTLSLLKQKIISHFDERLDLYNSLEKVSNPELYEKAIEAITKCKTTIRYLSQGEIRDKRTVILDIMSSKISDAKFEVLAVHWAKTVKDIETWEKPHMKNYYGQNILAVQKSGVKVRRVFILDREGVLEPETDQLNPKVLSIMQQQQDDEIEVFVVWQQDIPSSYLLDLLIVDQKFAQFGLSAGGFVSGLQEQEASCTIDINSVSNYRAKFIELMRYAQDLESWLDSNFGARKT